MADVKSQLSGVGKGAVKQVLAEPLEILKDAGGQLSGEAIPSRTRNPQAGERSQLSQEQPATSIEEKRRSSRLAAMEQEIKEIGQQREQAAVGQQRLAEQQKKQQEEHLENTQKESMFQKGLKMVTGRLKRRMETRLPKAA